MQYELNPIPEKISISPFGIAIYNDYSFLPKRIKDENFKMPSNKTGGVLSQSAKKNLKNCVGYLILRTQKRYATARNKFPNISKKIGFITLTLPSIQNHVDTEIKDKCLNQFLVEIRKYYDITEYVWRAEKQYNSNIHFHILVNKFIPHAEIRERWNRIIDKFGYVERYKNKFKDLTFREFIQVQPIRQKKGHRMEDRIRQYARGKETNWSSPNSTDIHNLKHVDNAARYISKYVSKSVDDNPKIVKQKSIVKSEVNEIEKMFQQQKLEELRKEESVKQKIEGRIWFASESLTAIKNINTYLTSEIKSELEGFILHTSAKEIKTDFCFYINRGIENIAQYARGALTDLVDDWIKQNLQLTSV